MSFIFYDTETTGTETFFDQILQFAAIRADDDLKEVDRIEVRCRLQPHVVPHPEAMHLCGTRAARLSDAALQSHYEMVRTIRAKLLEWSPSLFVGWNSIRFDEALLRQALYQTLHPPYLTNTNNNSRSDGMRLVQASTAHVPGALVMPVDAEGGATFKLSAVAAANGFRSRRAHDALADAEATLHICRILAQRAPDLWSSFMRYSTKAAVTEFITTEQVFGVTTYYGRAYSRLVTAMAPAKDNPAEWYVFDLDRDPDGLVSMSDLELQVTMEGRDKPVRRLKSNESPSLFTFDDAPERCPAKGHGLEELERRAKLVAKDTSLGKRLLKAMEIARPQYPASEHVEQQIYSGFPSREDETLMESFHRAPWSQRAAIVERFSDKRLKRLGFRLLHIERPNLLPRAVRDQHDLEIAQRVLGQDDMAPWLTLPKAMSHLEGLLPSVTVDDASLLQEHAQFLRDRQAWASARLGAASL